MLFLVLVIFNGHITSRSIVPHVLGHFTLSSYVAFPSSVGMDPSLLVPLGDLKQGGKVADLSPGHLLPPPILHLGHPPTAQLALPGCRNKQTEPLPLWSKASELDGGQ